MTIDVYLDTTQTPPVTVVPQVKDKDKGKGTITWKPASGQDFSFVSLTFVSNPGCFGVPDVKPNKITVDDDNSGGTSVGDFPYVIVVSFEGKNYSSATPGPGAESSDPTIRNKPN